MRYSIFAGLVFCFVANIASADENGLTNRFSECMDKSGGVTLNMNECINEEFKIQDARLNKAYKEIISELSPARKKQLQEAQRAWIKYRDANCAFYADPDGGTVANLIANDRFMSMTAERAKELEGLKEQN